MSGVERGQMRSLRVVGCGGAGWNEGCNEPSQTEGCHGPEWAGGCQSPCGTGDGHGPYWAVGCRSAEEGRAGPCTVMGRAGP